MMKSKFSEEQIAYALRLAERRTAVADVCRQLGIGGATPYVWKKKFATPARVRLGSGQLGTALDRLDLD